MAFDSRIDSGDEASESTAPPALCAFIVMTALAAAMAEERKLFFHQRAKALLRKAGIACSCFPIDMRRSGQ